MKFCTSRVAGNLKYSSFLTFFMHYIIIFGRIFRKQKNVAGLPAVIFCILKQDNFFYYFFLGPNVDMSLHRYFNYYVLLNIKKY